MIRYFLFITAITTSACLGETHTTQPYKIQKYTNAFIATPPFLHKSRGDTFTFKFEDKSPSKHSLSIKYENQISQKGIQLSNHTGNTNVAARSSKKLTSIDINACDQNDLAQSKDRAAECTSQLLENLAPVDTELYQRHFAGEGRSAESMKASLVLLSLGGNLKQAYQVSNKNRDLKTIFWHILSEVGTVQDLYLYTIMENTETIQALPIRTKKKVADRLIRSSAPNIAKKWVAGNLPASMRTRYMKYMLSGIPYGNLEPTDAVTGYLLSMANQGAGNIEASFKWLNERNFPPELQYSEKLLGSPQPDDPTAWGELSRRIALPEDIARMPQLQASRSLIEHSQATRQSLASLIAETNTDPRPQGSSFEFAD